MRVSVKQGDPGYHPDALLFDIMIKLDGMPVKNCVTADEEEGMIVTIGKPNGEMDQMRNWETQEVVTYGRVEIIRDPSREHRHSHRGFQPTMRSR